LVAGHRWRLELAAATAFKGGTMKGVGIPVFRGRRALLLHKPDRDRHTLESQLTRLGMHVECRTAADPSQWPLVDLCLFDADAEKRHLFPWSSGEPDIPLIALLGTETPERIQWSLGQGVAAFLVKPIRSNGTYLALLQAEHHFVRIGRVQAEINELRERVKSRRIIFKALLQLMKHWNLDEDQAFERLRAISMERSVSVEELCVAILCGDVPLTCDAVAKRRAR
jgi:AmiR/NasT family two-component response regulator